MHKIKASYLTLAAWLVLISFVGCDNRTGEATRWDQIAKDQKKDPKDQPWEQAKEPWRNDHNHEGTAW